MKKVILVINRDGETLADELVRSLNDATLFRLHEKRGKEKKSLSEIVGRLFSEYDGLIFIAAMGIVVRLISPYINNKLSDPAVVAVDTAGRFSISVLSGHEGGANDLSYLVAGILDATPVITTGTEVHKGIIIGIGCRRGINVNSVKSAIIQTLKEKNISLESVRIVATIDLKKDEKGLLDACSELNLPLSFISKDSILNYKMDDSFSEIVKRNIGVDGVCEPCAILAGRRPKLVLRKRIIEGVTIAIAKEA